MESSKQIDETYEDNLSENLRNQFLNLASFCPEFASCQNETIEVLESFIFENYYLKAAIYRCLADKVYRRDDEEKSPVLYVYVESYEFGESGERFYVADKNEGQFIEFSREEFEKTFECYDMHLEDRNGIRPWEDERAENTETDLSNSSGKSIPENEEEK